MTFSTFATNQIPMWVSSLFLSQSSAFNYLTCTLHFWCKPACNSKIQYQSLHVWVILLTPKRVSSLWSISINCNLERVSFNPMHTTTKMTTHIKVTNLWLIQETKSIQKVTQLFILVNRGRHLLIVKSMVERIIPVFWISQVTFFVTYSFTVHDDLVS